jgi:hypothetical protein
MNRVRALILVVYLLAIALVVALLLALGVTPAHAATTLTRSQVRGYITAAADHYHLSAASTRWVLSRGLRIVERESHFHPHSVNKHTGATGLFQFMPSWKHKRGMGFAPGHHHKDWRLCGECSCWRAVKAYRAGGKAAWHRAWGVS